MTKEYYIGYKHQKSWVSPPDEVLFISLKKDLAEETLKATFPNENCCTHKYIQPISKEELLEKISKDLL